MMGKCHRGTVQKVLKMGQKKPKVETEETKTKQKFNLQKQINVEMVRVMNDLPSDYKTSERNSQNTIFNNKESSINF